LYLFYETLIFAENKRYFLRDACGGEAILFYNEKLMKYLITLFALFTIYIYGCGDDNTTNTNNNGNGESVIYSLDSLSIYLTSSVGSVDTNLVVINASNIRVTFNCSTNTDSVNSISFYRIFAQDSSNVYIDTTNNYISALNGNHAITVNGSTNFFLNILIQINRNDLNPYFIKLKDIKVIKL